MQDIFKKVDNETDVIVEWNIQNNLINGFQLEDVGQHLLVL